MEFVLEIIEFVAEVFIAVIGERVRKKKKGDTQEDPPS